MAEEATPVVQATVAITTAAQAYLPGGIGEDEFIIKVLEAVNNPKIIAALAAHGHPVRGEGAEPSRLCAEPEPQGRARVSSVAAMVLGRKPSLTAYKLTGGLWRSPPFFNLSGRTARAIRRPPSPRRAANRLPVPAPR
jgi:hypothetical protein